MREELIWRNSSWSDPQQSCVEVAWPSEVTAVRDSKCKEAPGIAVSRDAWRALVSYVSTTTS